MRKWMRKRMRRKRSLVRAIVTMAMMRVTRKMSNIWLLTIDLTQHHAKTHDLSGLSGLTGSVTGLELRLGGWLVIVAKFVTNQTNYITARGAILKAVDTSLKRLGTDYIDLLQIHRYDASVPPEETMKALHDLVQAGKVHYIGASSMWTYQFAR